MQTLLVKVELSYLPVINFAMQQNRVPTIRQLTIENTSDTILKNLQVKLICSPNFGDILLYVVESISPGEIVRIDTLKLDLDTTYFAQLTERLAGSLELQITSEETQLIKQKYPIDILAYDEWGGLSILPEMLSAFITPNHPSIAPIIKRAATILHSWTGNASLDEYQSRNPDRVRKQMAAIYTALSEQNIIYSTVPASFEKTGQRIRLIDAVLTQKLATCLDIALLYASCLEAVGINPIIVVTNGHAFAGAWLVPETFADSIIDDVSSLTKRTADGINDITLIETTCMCYGSNTEFDKASDIANGKLKQSSDFILALDVKRSRTSGIRPIPQRVLKGLEWVIEETNDAFIDKSQVVPESIQSYDLSGIEDEKTVLTKQLIWERKLLDLSLRNNLLNIRITKNTLQLISTELDKLEDALADGEEFRIINKPSDWENPLFEFGLYQSVEDSDPIIELVKSEISQKRLRTYLTEGELGKSLTHLYRSSRTAMEENGANTLYIALGLLKWYETPNSERPRYAPILLLPVEIIRKSAATGYIIRSREEDSIMNVTLLEMLRQNFGITISGLDPLPTDESGVNVRLIYSIIRNAIKNQDRWDVAEEAILGIFSFNKFIMWNDIHNNAHKLIENKMVLSLINGKIEWDAQDEMTDASILDKQLSSSDLILPISADSSQMEAIYEAVNDKSFILHGPPGTGKSQTITNIIANALYKGKRVLFVAEKMAALSVVQSRLAAIGLSPFCLEIHSNKLKKSVIMDQLREASEVTHLKSVEDFEEDAQRLFKLKSELGAYVDSLHERHSIGLSLYEIISRYLSISEDAIFSFPESLLLGVDKNTLLEWQDALEALVSTSNACGHPYKHPLSGINISSYSGDVRERAKTLFADSAKLLATIKDHIAILRLVFGDTSNTYTKQDIDYAITIVNILLTIPELTPQLITMPRLGETLEEHREILEHGIKRDKLRNEILTEYSDGIFSLDGNRLLTEWKQYSQKWFIPKFFGQRGIKKQLKFYSKKGRIENSTVTTILDKIIEYKTKSEYINKYVDIIPNLFGKYGKRDDQDWETIAQIIDNTEVINKSIFGLVSDISETSQLKETIAKKLTEGIIIFREMYAKPLTDLSALFGKLTELQNILSSEYGVELNTFYGESELWADSSITQLNTWSDNLDKLKDWYQWLQICERFKKLKLKVVVEAYTDRNIESERIQNIFDKSMYMSYANHIISKNPKLEFFKGEIFNDSIHKFKKLTLDFETLTKQELYARLAANIPSFTREATQNSEVGILQRNIRNNARGTSIRKLFDQIPTLLNRMCPCMLMSPISVAQYIDTDAEKFDLVIFDEASQMSSSEAVGAIARGKNIVVVGDPKQLPPTSFFAVNNVDEDNMDMEDLESILDDCLALSIPSKYLSWHYRSKHESLIAFSNAEYYDGRLFTFPSPDNMESKVRLIHVDGFYDKGKSRQNKAEAQAIIDEIVRRLTDEKLREISIGVVTFSSVQQTLIEDMLSDVFLFNPHLEKLALECKEPIFIKNLENVQGDERDVILFSIGYGADKDGKVSMNFGPLNRQGGERRLNVAVSRSRYEMIIYSTLRHEQIDLNRTSSEGVAGLKRFLEYAQRGEKIIMSRDIVVNSSPTMEFHIANALRNIGYEIHTNIGYSGYKIDIGVVDKKNPSNYILGILCDGENYRDTKTVRDREIVQNSVLKLLGWNICRVWTMDWWEDQSCILERLKTLIMNLESGTLSEEQEKDTTPIENISKEPEIEHNKQSNLLPYQLAKVPPIKQSGEEFYFPSNRTVILAQIRKILDTESPISRSLICKRILTIWGISRMGQKMDIYIEEILNEAKGYKTQHEDLNFYWVDEDQYNTYTTFRPDSDRTSFDLPPEEVANGIKHILEAEISLPSRDLMKATAQLFNFARSGANVDAAMSRGLSEALENGYLKIEDDRAIIA